jgi:hypothetical protein
MGIILLIAVGYIVGRIVLEFVLSWFCVFLDILKEHKAKKI